MVAATTGAGYRELLARQRRDFDAAMMAGARRLRWPPDRLAAERQRRLRDLLGWAVTESPFYRARFRGVDVDNFTEADLPKLPVLTKAEMMANFDDLVTDRRLSLDRVHRHLEGLDADAYLFDRYRVVSTSGSTGTRGLLVYDWDEWCTFAAIATRWQGREKAELPPGHVTASFFASNPRHISGALHAFFRHSGRAGAGLAGGAPPVLHLPASLPFPEVVAALNEADPPPLAFSGYPSFIRLLALEAESGGLHVSPRHVATCGERCGPDVVDAVRQNWGVGVYDYWGCTEGVYAFPCGQGPGMHLPDDLVVAEAVDANGGPVPEGTPGHSILLTLLYTKAQPLIRYEIGDQVALGRGLCACGCAHSRMDSIVGRGPVSFVYPDGTKVHCLGLESIISATGWVAEIQVDQTVGGVQVRVASRGPADCEGLRGEIVAFLSRSGLANPEVTVKEVAGGERLWSGKLQQFRPLALIDQPGVTSAGWTQPRQPLAL